MHFVIIGNGVAGTTAAFAIREREPDASITLIGGETDYFFSRTALMYGFMDRLSIRDMEPFERKVYDRKNVKRVRDIVTDLDADARTIVLKSAGSVQYDRLL
ncbi:MAG: NAD(P)/FAD-dependent oxidoreductase, partial [Acidobacteriota bacterium]|nr:NAD(P)/FAD-dependent oxidoreductase [Acidobacteriota bacterium]